MLRILFSFLLLVAALPARCQDGFLRDFSTKWEQRATRTQAVQPRWSVPMFSPFPMLAQVFRTDFTRQPTEGGGGGTWNYGSGKGFNLIPFANTQVDIFVPGYIVHGDDAQDGFGDMTLLGKYRFFAGNEQHGNYIVSGALAWNIPTGSYKNGAASSSLTPTLLTGKGFGRFTLMSSLGGSLPTSHVATTGRTIHWNSVAQYRVGRYFFPEVELNSNTYLGGPRDGKTQIYLSPGIIVGRLPIRSVEKSRLGITLGAGFQTAITSYHASNHIFQSSVRFVF